MSVEEIDEDQGQDYDNDVDQEETLKRALGLVDKDAAERRGEEYIAPPTEEALIELSMQKAVKVVSEVEKPAVAEEVDSTMAEAADVTTTAEKTDDEPSFFQRVRSNVGLRAAGAAIVLGAPAVAATGCSPQMNETLNNMTMTAEQTDQRKVNEFMQEYAAEWSGGPEVPGLKVELIRPVLESGEATSNVGTWMHVGEYNIVVPEGYSIQRLAINGSNEQVLADVWSGPLNENYSFYFRGTLAVYQDGNPNPVGSFSIHGR